MGKAGNKRRKNANFKAAANDLLADYQAMQEAGVLDEDVSEKEYIAALKDAQHDEEKDNLNDNLTGLPWDDIAEIAKAGPPRKEQEVSDLEAELRRTTLISDVKTSFPQLNLQIYLNTHPMDKPAIAEMFVRCGCMNAPTLEEADLVVFGGGLDVDPSYYGVTSHHSSVRSSEDLDLNDMEIYLQCFNAGIPMLGICRGMQFLHVANSGKLYQDVDNHNRAHPVTDTITGEILGRVSSVHHQMCYPNKDMEILAVAHVSRHRWLPSNVKDVATDPIDDIEAFFYRDTACLGFQGHPEYKGFNYYTLWCMKQIENYICLNPDMDWENGYLRLKQDLRDERDSFVKGAK